MSTIYTKYGDGGYTYTKLDSKTPKSHNIVRVLGEIDELNSHIGLLHASLCPDKRNIICDFLEKIMDSIFHVGAFVGYGQALEGDALQNLIEKMEKTIDEQEKENGLLKNFILPTGTKNCALAHVARSVCRRVERSVYSLEEPKHYEKVHKFFNRLSDYLFSLARTVNRIEFGEEIIWKSVNTNDVI